MFFKDCAPATADVVKIFSTYWLVGARNEIPDTWPASLSPNWSQDTPGTLTINGSDTSLYFSVAPPPLRPPGWTADLDDILTHFRQAKSFIHIEMMDFFPAIMYRNPPVPKYWGVLYDAIREVAFNNGTQFRILIGYWNNSIPHQQAYLQGLNLLPNIEVRYFLVPRTCRRVWAVCASASPV